jgi:hypothetical protein
LAAWSAAIRGAEAAFELVRPAARVATPGPLARSLMSGARRDRNGDLER